MATDEDAPVAVTLAGTDPDGDPLTFSVVSGPAHGAYAGGTYTPSADFNGADSFTYKANDGRADSNVATVTITVRAVNDTPVPVADTTQTRQGQAVSFPAATLAVNDSPGPLDEATQTLRVDAVNPTSETKGTVALAGGTVTYSPSAGFTGTDRFAYTVCDNGTPSQCAAGTAEVQVTANGPPVASDQSVVTDEDMAVDITLAATDPDSDELTFTVVDGPSRGTIAGSGNTRRYTPAPNFNGVDGFTFKANDGPGDSNLATVSITVPPMNDPPVAVADGKQTAQGQTLTFPASDLTLNDSPGPANESDQHLSVPGVLPGPEAHGQVSLSAGAITYMPDPDFSGPATFGYSVCDDGSSGGQPDAKCADGVVTVTVLAGHLPAARADHHATDQDTALTVPKPGLLGNDTDTDGDALTATVADEPAHGTVAVQPDGSFTYTPSAGYVGADSFTYSACDPGGGCSRAPVEITITAACAATNKSVAFIDFTAVDHVANTATGTLRGVTVGLSGSDITENGFIIDGTSTRFDHPAFTPRLAVTDSVEVVGRTGNSYRFAFSQPVANPTMHLASLASTLTFAGITLGKVSGQDTLVASGSTVQGVLDDTSAFTDANGTIRLFGVFEEIAFTTTLSAPTQNNQGDGIYLQLGAAGCGSPPVATGAALTTAEDTALPVTLTATDIDGDTLSYTTTNPSRGMLSGTGSTRTYTPAADFNGTDSFTFKASDGAAESNIATVTIDVTPVNDPPVPQPDAYEMTVADFVPGSSTVYGVNAETVPSVLYTFDKTTAAPTEVGTIRNIAGEGLALGDVGLTYDPAVDRLYLVDGGGAVDHLMVVDPATGIAQFVGTGLGVAHFDPGLAFDPVSRRLFMGVEPGVEGGRHQLYEIDTTSGVATLIGDITSPLSGLNANVGLAFDWRNRRLYATFGNESPTDLYTLDIVTAVATLVGGTGAVHLTGIDYDPSTDRLYASDSLLGRLYRLDPTTGAGTLIGSDGLNNVEGIAVKAAFPSGHGRLSLPAADLASNDTAGPASESTQELTVTKVLPGPSTSGEVRLSAGTVTYIPQPGFSGVATFRYEVCDDGTTSGAADPRCAEGTGTVVVRSCVPPPAGLVAWWRGEGDAIDAAGGHDGTPVGNVGFSPGLVGRAFALNGPQGPLDPNTGYADGDYVAIPDAPSLTPQSMTVDAWIKADALSDYRPIVTKYGKEFQTSWVFDLIDGRLRLEVLESWPVHRAAISTTTLSPGEWHHVAGTFDLASQAFALYVDGVAQPFQLDGTTVSSIMDSTTDVRIGTIRNQPGGFEGFFDGLIDEVQLFARALGASEINAIADAGSAGKCRFLGQRPTATGQAVTTPEDVPVNVTLAGADPDGDALTFTVVTPPQNGSLTGIGPVLTYTPAADYNGPDSFTFKVNDGQTFSPAATVAITVTPVNDPPSAARDPKSVGQDGTLVFPASELATNDTPGPANESGQHLSVEGATPGPDTHGHVVLAAGTITYTPDAGYVGPATFHYLVCDDGTSGGLTDSKCAPGVVEVQVYAPGCVAGAPAAADSSTGTDGWSPTASMSKARNGHAMARLPDGRVLAIGGSAYESGIAVSLGLTEIYDEASGTWTVAAPMRSCRALFPAAVLADGRVLAAGGWDYRAQAALSTAELFDTVTGRWTSIASMAEARYAFTMTVLPTGRVLVAGGANTPSTAGSAFASAEVYDPSTDTWATAATMASPRNSHGAVLLNTGEMLVAGGSRDGAPTASAELYNPSTNSWRPAGDMGTPRAGFVATLLPDGRVLVAGGATATAEVYDPATNAFTPVAPMSKPRAHPVAELLADGSVLVAGGYTGPNAETHHGDAERWLPTTGVWVPAGQMAASVAGAAESMLLPSGRVLVAGGSTATQALAGATIYSLPPAGCVGGAPAAQDSSPGTEGWSPTTSLSVARSHLASVRIGDGRVIAIGGAVDENGNPVSVGLTEIYDEASGTWTAAAPMGSCRALFPAAVLADGRVLAAGGEDYRAQAALSTAEAFDPAGGRWNSVAAMAEARYAFTLTVLADGRVLAAGGTYTPSATQSSLRSTELFDPASGSWSAGAPMSTTRTGHAAVRLNTGEVLVVGGREHGAAPTVKAELYNPATNSWRAAGDMHVPREGLTATLLADGRVLVVGGDTDYATPTATAELYDPMTNAFTATTPMAKPRYAHTAAPLPDGSVLVAGGRSATADHADSERWVPRAGVWVPAGEMAAGVRGTTVATTLLSGRVLTAGGTNGQAYSQGAAVYTLTGCVGGDGAPPDSTSGTNGWSPTAGLTVARRLHTAVRLADGRVMVMGGRTLDQGVPVDVGWTEIYDEATERWTVAAPMRSCREIFPAAVLSDGRVLAAGGHHNSTLSKAEVFDPTTRRWSPVADMAEARYASTATVLLDGRVLVAGGSYTLSSNDSALSSAELFDPGAGTWSPAAPMATTRNGHVAVLLSTGEVLVAGGRQHAAAPTTRAELYNPSTNIWRAAGEMHTPRLLATATLLPDGRVLVAGGDTSYQNPTEAAEVYDPSTNAFTPVASMTKPRFLHAATPLGDGSVLVAGGSSGPAPGPADDHGDAERWLPASNTWVPAGTMAAGVRGATVAELLPSGRVLVAGGGGDDLPLAGAALYTPDRPPHAAADRYGTNRDMELAVPAPGVLINDSDSDGDVLTATVVSGPAHGALSLGADGSFTYTPSSGYTGADSFTYSACDPGGLCSTAPVALTVHTVCAPDQDPGPAAPAGSPKPANAFGGFVPTGSMAHPRDTGRAVPLKDGRVLAVGGANLGFDASAEIYDPASGLWTAAGRSCQGRSHHTASLLADGRVLVVGGTAVDAVLASTELYDPATGVWSAGPDLQVARSGHGAFSLEGGRILVVGGHGPGFEITATAEIFDAVANTWTRVADAATPRLAIAGAVLPGGQILVAGGFNSSASAGLRSTERFDPATGTWSQAADLNEARGMASAVTMADGRVLIAGGDLRTEGRATVEIYDPTTGTWTFAAPMNLGDRNGPSLTLLPSAVVVMAGGFRGGSGSPTPTHDTAEVYDPVSDRWDFTGDMSTPRGGHSATRLADGRVLMAGGLPSFCTCGSGPANASADLFVPGTNRPPITMDGLASTVEDSAVGVELGATDADGDALAWSVVDLPAHGGLAGVGRSRLYTPDVNFNGIDQFTFRVNDGKSDSKLATVTITVTPVNDEPVAVADATSAVPGETLTFPTSDLLANDSRGPADEGSQTLTVTEVIPTETTNGTVKLDAGSITYQPASGFTGEADFDYRVCDDGTTAGAPDPQCAQGRVTVAVVTTNRPPVAQALMLTIDEDVATPVTLPATDPDGDGLTYVIVTSPAHGRVEPPGSGGANRTYVPTPDDNGADGFTFKANDGLVDSNLATVSITLVEVNDVPVATTDERSTKRGRQLSFSASALLANDLPGPANEAGQALSLFDVGATAATIGVVGFDEATGTVTYSPPPAPAVSDAFGYIVCDNGTTGGAPNPRCAQGVIAVTITENRPPTAPGATAAGDEDTPTPVVLLGSDPDSDPLTFTIVSGPAHGRVEPPSGTGPDRTYIPEANYNGPDSFTYKASDGEAESGVATVSITVNAVNDSPLAQPDARSTPAGIVLSFPVADLAVNDSPGPADEGTQTLTVTTATAKPPATHGTVRLDGTNVVYTPDAGFVGQATFAYRVCDDGTPTACADGTVNVAVGLTPVSIDVAPPGLRLRPTEKVQYQATAHYNDGSSAIVTNRVAWSTGDAGVATIGAGGLATAVAPGATTVSAVLDGVTGTTALTVADTVVTSIVVTPAQAVIIAGQTQSFAATGVHADGTSETLAAPELTWSTSDPNVAAISPAGVASGLAPGHATVTATLGGVSGTAALDVRPHVPNGGLPTVAITTPAPGATVTEPITVTGTATDPEFVKYVLDMAPAGESTFTTISESTTPVTAGPLGTLDPTVLINDLYTLRLTAVDAADNRAEVSVLVQVDREQKIGNFSVSFDDLTVPLSGIDVTVTRTYDSRDNQQGDFGIGWRLGVRDVRLRKIGGVTGFDWIGTDDGSGLSQVYCVTPGRTRSISMTMPGGELMRFEAAVEVVDASVVPGRPNCSRLSPPSVLRIVWRPATHTFGSLAAADLSSTVRVVGSFPGSVDLYADEDLTTPYDPQRFLASLRDGTQFTVTDRSDVERIADPKGNAITITPSGITHSAGPGVAFERDGLGRISAIVDPAGRRLRYEYDANGDLSARWDRAGEATRFSYDRRHNLLSIVDPLGRLGVRNQYDDSGRLVKVIDADGHEVNLSHDLVGDREEVRDRRGKLTIFTYDAFGNVLSETNAEGETTRHEYNANGDETATIDALMNRTERQFDDHRNLEWEKTPLGHRTRFEYGPFDQVTKTVDPVGTTTVNDYDPTTGNLRSTTVASSEATAGDATLPDACRATTRFTYDAAGNVRTQTDALGRVTEHFYDATGRLVRTLDAQTPVRAETTYEYDANGNRTSQTDALGRVTHYEYDAENRLVRTIHPDLSWVQTIYDPAGRVAATVDEAGRVTRNDYDDQGRQIRTRFPDGTATGTEYDENANPTATIDQLGRRTITMYDGANRPIRVTHPDTSFTTTDYDAAGRAADERDERGNLTTTHYDADGRVDKLIRPLGNETQFGYDGAGRRLTERDANGNLTSFEYDCGGRVTTTTYPATADQSMTTRVVAYDALGRRISDTDQAGEVTHFDYDEVGRLTTVIDAKNQQTTYAYDLVGNRTAQTDARRHTTRIDYDVRNRERVRTLPGGQATTTEHDAAGNVASRLDANGRTTVFHYDDMNRLTEKVPDPVFGQPTVSFTYWPTGQRTTMVDAAGTTTYSYNDRDWLTEKAAPQGTLTYTYQPTGQLESMKSGNAGGARMVYDYDELNRLKTARDEAGPPGTTTYEYDPGGRLTDVTLPNGVVSTYTYDQLNRLKKLESTGPSGPLARYEYTLGRAGNRTGVAELSGRTVAYEYDDLYRLAKETVSGDPGGINGVVSYEYDEVGNRLSRTSTLSGVPSSTATYDANDRMSGETYDNNGNTLTNSEHTFTYDYEDRLTTAHGAAVRIQYDGDGNKVAETVGGVTTAFLVDDRNPTGYSQVIDELVGGAVTKAYAYGLDLLGQRDVPRATVGYYGYDGQSSVRSLISANGQLSLVYDYDAFGERLRETGSDTNRYKYVGESEVPRIEAYYMRARHYMPSSGRFVSGDPYPGAPDDPRTMHAYSYAANDPVDHLDPSGQFIVLLVAAAVVAQLAGYLTRGFDILRARSDIVRDLPLNVVSMAVSDVAVDAEVAAAKAILSQQAHINLIARPEDRISVSAMVAAMDLGGDLTFDRPGVPSSWTNEKENMLHEGGGSGTINAYFVNRIRGACGVAYPAEWTTTGQPSVVVPIGDCGGYLSGKKLAHEIAHLLLRGDNEIADESHILSPSLDGVSVPRNDRILMRLSGLLR
ncbi:MAG: Ig-like domain-containing protein [Acidimicrobiales bacterium]